MGKMFSLLYGLAAYAAAMATLAYFAGFSGNLVVPKSVDTGATVSTWLAVCVDLLLLLAFGLQHSVMARPAFKQWWARMVPPVVERSTFLVASCVMLAALFCFWLPIREPVVWRVEHPVGVALLWSLFALGWLVLVGSSYMLDHWELFGLRQVIAPLLRHSHNTQPTDLRTPLLYRHIRHPLYLGFLLGLWAVPVMTAGRLLFAAGLSVYILIGIAFEERDLIRQFGDRYRRYREQAGMLLPRLRSSHKA